MGYAIEDDEGWRSGSDGRPSIMDWMQDRNHDTRKTWRAEQMTYRDVALESTNSESSAGSFMMPEVTTTEVPVWAENLSQEELWQALGLDEEGLIPAWATKVKDAWKLRIVVVIRNRIDNGEPVGGMKRAVRPRAALSQMGPGRAPENHGAYRTEGGGKSQPNRLTGAAKLSDRAVGAPAGFGTTARATNSMPAGISSDHMFDLMDIDIPDSSGTVHKRRQPGFGAAMSGIGSMERARPQDVPQGVQFGDREGLRGLHAMPLNMEPIPASKGILKWKLECPEKLEGPSGWRIWRTVVVRSMKIVGINPDQGDLNRLTEQADNAVIAQLLNSLGPKLFNTYAEGATAGSIWLGLHNAMAPSVNDRIQALWDDINNLKIEGKESAAQYITRAEELFTKHQNACPGMEKNFYVRALVKGCASRYDGLWRSVASAGRQFIGDPDQQEKMYAEARAMIHDFELDYEMSRDIGGKFGHGGGSKSSGQNGSGSGSGGGSNDAGKKAAKKEPSQQQSEKKFDGLCHRCGRSGHKSKDCFAKTHQDGHALADSAAGEKPAAKCYNCGKLGHIAKNCPTAENHAVRGRSRGGRRRSGGSSSDSKEDESNHGTANGAKVLTFVVQGPNTWSVSERKENPWLFDTGSDVHIGNRFAKVEAGSRRPLPPNYVVQTGGGERHAQYSYTALVDMVVNQHETVRVRLERCVIIPDFPICVISGKIWYEKGGSIEGNAIVRGSTKCANIVGGDFYVGRHPETGAEPVLPADMSVVPRGQDEIFFGEGYVRSYSAWKQRKTRKSHKTEMVSANNMPDKKVLRLPEEAGSVRKVPRRRGGVKTRARRQNQAARRREQVASGPSLECVEEPAECGSDKGVNGEDFGPQMPMLVPSQVQQQLGSGRTDGQASSETGGGGEIEHGHGPRGSTDAKRQQWRGASMLLWAAWTYWLFERSRTSWSAILMA